MKPKKRTVRGSRLRAQLPFLAHLCELVIAIVILAAGQNVWAVVVRADGDITPPTVPTGLLVTGRSATSIDLSWSPSTDDTSVAGYHVYRNGTLVATPTLSSFSDNALVPNTTYNYTVSAFDSSANESAQSTPLAATTLIDTTPPSTPTDLHQTGQSVSTVSIAWDASSDNVGVASYNIYRNGSLVRNQVGTSYTDNGLAVYTNYVYSVAALDAANNISQISSSLVASTAPDTVPPSIPDNIRINSSTVNSITLGWDASTDNVGVAGYRVYRNGILVGTPGGTSFTDTGLTVSSSYTYTISAYDAAGNVSAQSAPYTASSSNDTTPPTIPTNIRSTSVLDNSISISWDASTDNVSVAGYKIYRGGVLIGTSTATSFSDTGLSPVTSYTYTVKAYDQANNDSAFSAPFTVSTAYDTTPPTVPTQLSSPTQTDTAITLSWKASTDNIAVSGYDVYRNGTLITTTSGTTFTDSGLGVKTAYSYQVDAVDTSGNHSAETAASIFSTLPDTTPPSAPPSVASSNQTMTSIDLVWSAATDDVAVASYNVYRNGQKVANVSGLTYTDSNLTYGTSYTYTVTAIDTSGNESVPSGPLDISTLPDTTPPVISLTAPPDNSTQQLTFPITATASDLFSISKVEFYVDTQLVTTITSAPYTFNWNSYGVHNGNHLITAEAVNGAGGTASQSVTINVNNPPPTLVGDLNGDHKVNLYDLSILLSHWGKPGLGDIRGDGHVDLFDLSILLSHYGEDDSNYH